MRLLIYWLCSWTFVFALEIDTFALDARSRLCNVFLDSDVVVVGELKSGVGGGRKQPMVTLEVRETLKLSADVIPHPLRRIPISGVTSDRIGEAAIAFCKSDGEKSKVIAFRYIREPSERRYLDHLPQVVKDGHVERLGFHFDHLDHSSAWVRADARSAFQNASYQQLTDASERYKRGKIIARLDTRSSHATTQIDACLLGICGRRNDAGLLLRRIAEIDAAPTLTVLFASASQLDREVGIAVIMNELKNGESPFSRRYAALRALRFLSVRKMKLHRSTTTTVLETLDRLLKDDEIADLIINFYRKERRWERTDVILKLDQWRLRSNKALHHSMIRYCLKATGPRAKDFILAQRQQYPKLVNRLEQHLRLEEERERKHGNAEENIHRNGGCAFGSD